MRVGASSSEFGFIVHVVALCWKRERFGVPSVVLAVRPPSEQNKKEKSTAGVWTYDTSENISVLVSNLYILNSDSFWFRYVRRERSTRRRPRYLFDPKKIRSDPTDVK